MLNSVIKTLFIGGFLFGLLQTAYADPCKKEQHLCDKYFKDHIDLIIIKSGETAIDAKNKIDKKIKYEFSKIKDLMTKDEIADINNHRTFLNKIKSYDEKINKQIISLKKIIKDKGNQKRSIAENKITIKSRREKEKKLESFIKENYGSEIFKPILLIYNGLFCDEECKKDENSYINKMASLKKTQNDIYKLNDHIKKSYKSIKESTVDEAKIRIQKKELQDEKMRVETTYLSWVVLELLKKNVGEYEYDGHTFTADVKISEDVKKLKYFITNSKVSKLNLTITVPFGKSMPDRFQNELFASLKNLDLSSIRSLKLKVIHWSDKSNGFIDFLASFRTKLFVNKHNLFEELELNGSIATFCLLGGKKADLSSNSLRALKKLTLINSDDSDAALNITCGSNNIRRSFNKVLAKIIAGYEFKELRIDGNFGFNKDRPKLNTIIEVKTLNTLALYNISMADLDAVMNNFYVIVYPSHSIDNLIIKNIINLKNGDREILTKWLEESPVVNMELEGISDQKLLKRVIGLYQGNNHGWQTLKIDGKKIAY